MMKTHLFKLLMLSTALSCHQAVATELNCGNNVQAQELAKLIQFDHKQQRKDLTCNNKLNKIALTKAKLIHKHQEIWHNAGHLTPNQLLRHHNFKLPRTYPVFGNQVEAIAGGEADIELVYQDFMNSTPHRQLILGEDKFFKAQNQMGVAYLKDLSTEYQHYWVVIIADEKNQTIELEPIIDIEPAVDSRKRSRGRAIKNRMYRNKIRNHLYQ